MQRAILIGIDNYDFAPLSSCVNDAVAMRDTVVSLNLFKTQECTLLTFPANSSGNAERPTRNAILDALLPIYEAQRPIDRLLVYYAGHGLAVRLGREADALRTVLVPAGVAQLKDMGNDVIDLDELLGRFARRGAREQFWIIDACRNLPPEGNVPYVATIGWDLRGDLGLMAQAVLYAVAPLARARSVKGGHGLVTGHLLDGLACRGEAEWGAAGWYDEGLGNWLIDLESLKDYAARRVGNSMPASGWEREYLLPRVWYSEKKPGPLRNAGTLPDRPFGVFIDPLSAAGAVSVALSVKRHLVAAWPPRGNGERVPLAPERYRLAIGLSDVSHWLAPKIPDPAVVDVREVDRLDLTFLAKSGAEVPPDDSHPPDDGHPPDDNLSLGDSGASMRVSISGSLNAPLGVSTKGLGTTGDTSDANLPPTVSVRASDPGATVRFTRLSGGNEQREAKPNVTSVLSEGLWQIEVMLGADTIAKHDEDLAAGEHYEISNSAQVTSALAGLITQSGLAVRAGDDPPNSLQLSDRIGPMQGAIMPTLLPLLAVKPFDIKGEVLGEFTKRLDIPRVSVRDLKWGQPAALAIAFDGAWEEKDLSKVVQETSVSFGSPIEALWRDDTGRVALFVATEDRVQDQITISIPELGEVRVAAPHSWHHCVTAAVTLWPDGRVDSSISLFNFPLGQNQWVPLERVSRALTIASRLNRVGATLDDLDHDLFSSMAYEKWNDPLLPALAWFAWAKRPGKREMDERFRHVIEDRRKYIQSLLGHFHPFIEISDSRIVTALAEPEDVRLRELDAMLDDSRMEQPVLADALCSLARHAIARERMDHWSVSRFQSLATDTVFNVVRRSARAPGGTLS